MSVPVVAIVGRPNVGKSSLFNWLAGKRIAIVEPTAGVTRDRLTALIKLPDDRYFELIDTGGMGIEDVDNLTAQVEKQIEAAIERAHVLLFVVDARSGLMPLDEEVGRRLRYVTKPIVLVANKCDTAELEQHATEFYKLGRGKLVCVSAHQGRGKGDLLDLIASRLPDKVEPTQDDVAMKVAIVGRRNTGKSTFINCLAESERMIVSEVAGTTRDSVDVRFDRDGKTFIAIDTAGVRRKKSIADDLEFLSMARAERSVRRADVVLLFLDPRVRISKVDKQLAGYVLDNHKPAIFVVNKWDLMRPMPTEKFGVYLRATFPNLEHVPIAFITAQNGKNVHRVLNLAQSLFKQALTRVSTAEVNKVLRKAITKQSPPTRQNRRPKIFYGTQVATAPPTIVLFTNGPDLFDNTYQRYLLNCIREKLPFGDVPIKFYLRHKHRDDQMPQDGAPGRDTALMNDTDTELLAGLDFKSEVTDDDLKSKRKHYDSELWQDL